MVCECLRGQYGRQTYISITIGIILTLFMVFALLLLIKPIDKWGNKGGGGGGGLDYGNMEGEVSTSETEEAVGKDRNNVEDVDDVDDGCRQSIDVIDSNGNSVELPWMDGGCVKKDKGGGKEVVSVDDIEDGDYDSNKIAGETDRKDDKDKTGDEERGEINIGEYNNLIIDNKIDDEGEAGDEELDKGGEMGGEGGEKGGGGEEAMIAENDVEPTDEIIYGEGSFPPPFYIFFFFFFLVNL